jgi:putative peptide zinc metalloprotease protein
MRWLVTLLLALAAAFAATIFEPGPAWAEMPADRALLTVDRGRVTAYLSGSPIVLVPGDRRYVGAGSQVDVPASASGLLTFPGGSAALLCPGSRVTVGRLSTDAGRHPAPFATLSLQSGRVLADTAATSGAFEPLSLTFTRMRSDVTNEGAAWFAVEPATVAVSTGTVSVGGAASPTSHASLSCGDGVPVSPPAAGGETSTTDAPFPTDSASIDPSAATATISPSVTATPSPTPDPTVTTTAPTEATTTKAPTTTTKPPTTKPTTPATTPPTTPPTMPPTTPATTPPTTPATTPADTTSAG